jgi:prepilin-type N-terminal cleavage/methylation domain-containing protein
MKQKYLKLKDFYQKGFTLIELVVVIAIIGVLSLLIVPNVFSYVESARVAYDNANVKILNNATALLAAELDTSTIELFDGIDSDTEKMEFLLDRGYLSDIPTPKSENARYLFSMINGVWSFNNAFLFYSDFTTNDNIIDLYNKGFKVINGVLMPTTSGENRALFSGTNDTDYNIKIDAKYSTSSSSQTGYGIYYRATNAGTDKTAVSGYCFQFDPGAGSLFTVRKVVNGKESSAFQSIPMKTIFPSGFDIKANHNIEIDVVGTRQIIKVDGVQVFDFNDSTFTQGSVGVRTWNNSTTQFGEATITPH